MDFKIIESGRSLRGGPWIEYRLLFDNRCMGARPAEQVPQGLFFSLSWQISAGRRVNPAEMNFSPAKCR